MHFFSKRIKQNKDTDIHLGLDTLTDDCKAKIEVLELPYRPEVKRKWSESVSQICNEENFFHDQFRYTFLIIHVNRTNIFVQGFSHYHSMTNAKFLLDSLWIRNYLHDIQEVASLLIMGFYRHFIKRQMSQNLFPKFLFSIYKYMQTIMFIRCYSV